jgi:hypothetical protein
MGVYRAVGHRKHIGLGHTAGEVVTGVGAAILAPVWRYVDAATMRARARRDIKPGTLWRDPPGRRVVEPSVRSPLATGNDTRRSA